MSFQVAPSDFQQTCDVVESAPELSAEIAHVQGSRRLRLWRRCPEISSTATFPNSSRSPRENELGRS